MGSKILEAAKEDDVALVRATLAGDRGAFQTLVERYQKRLFALARGYTRNPVDIEDIVQETFLKAYARLETFQHQASFYTWIYRIAVNTVLDFLKRHGRNPVQAVEDPELTGSEQTAAGEYAAHRRAINPAAHLEQAEIAEVTERVLEQIPEIFRTVLVLREFEECSYQEIADVLGISIGTVESRLFRARARFREKLLALYPEYADED